LKDLIKKIAAEKRPDRIDPFITKVKNDRSWNLEKLINDLIPYFCMESNLKYGSFHLVQMALFLKRLAKNNFFSRKTQFKLSEILLRELIWRRWTVIEAHDISTELDNPEEFSEKKILAEINKGSINNAFYRSMGLLEKNRIQLAVFLLKIASYSIPVSKGHTLASRFHLIKDIILAGEKDQYTALLSCIMHFSQYNAPHTVLNENFAVLKREPDHSYLLRASASGSSNGDIHQLNTFNILTEWENSSFNKRRYAPYKVFAEWVGNKPVDKEAAEDMENIKKFETASSYEDFSQSFSLLDINNTVHLVLFMLEKNFKQTVDWLYRIYADYYNPDNWDPHYFSCLYTGIQLFSNNYIEDIVGRRMALRQSLIYFAENISLSDKMAAAEIKLADYSID